MFALVKSGKVLNVIVADSEFIASSGAAIADGGQWVDVSNVEPRPGPGWTYSKGKFAPPVVTE